MDYLVKDLYEAAFLYSQGKELRDLRRENNFYWFVFEDKKDCEKSAADYWSGKAIGNIKSYSESIRILKERLFSQKLPKYGDENERPLYPNSK